MIVDNKLIVNGIKGAEDEINYILNALKDIKNVVIDLYVITPFGIKHIKAKKGYKEVEDISKNIANYDKLLKLRSLLIANKITIKKCYYGKKNLTDVGGTAEPKYLYAIKEGVGNISEEIVDSWEKCEPLVKGTLAVYKKFLTKEECYEYFKTVNIDEIKAKAKYQQEKDAKLKKLKEEYTKVEMWLHKDIVAYLDSESSKNNETIAKTLNNILLGYVSKNKC